MNMIGGIPEGEKPEEAHYMPAESKSFSRPPYYRQNLEIRSYKTTHLFGRIFLWNFVEY
ncbi:hypothetical protein [Halobacillus litoralis]|uniref:hypothetical protein n=1 Tax=Halobacillus litoralis TaxID=45668 RepID=UPI001CFF239A|nr:hypothetical protein [Halobacillus litoralis]